ncbi:MAG: PDZ domain-containing protein [Candidatus Hydrogenedentes bacterium]|nr:PDZ domain-containing protein [Candidatus Hydrogenedentota bacterium]
MTSAGGTNRKSLTKALSILLAITVLGSGCATLKKGITHRDYRQSAEQQGPANFAMNYTMRNSLVIDPARLESFVFEASLASGPVEVVYQAGLEAQARSAAEDIADQAAYLVEKLGLEFATTIKAYMIRLDYLPGTLEVQFPKDTNQVRLPLFVMYNNESWESVRDSNLAYPYAFAHELIEYILVEPTQKSPVLMDLQRPFIKVCHYTRWFREGLAGYGQLLVYRRACANRSAEAIGSAISPLQSNTIPQQPLSSLAKVNTDLFSWVSFDNDKFDAQLASDYYSAALGLFLLIENQFGEDAARRIVSNLSSRSYLDGKTLFDIFNQTLDTDIRTLVAQFTWPQIGLIARDLTPALRKNRGLEVAAGLLITEIKEGTPAAAAGLRQNDVIVAIGERRITNLLDLELALLAIGEQEQISVAVDRDGTAQIFPLSLHSKQ